MNPQGPKTKSTNIIATIIFGFSTTVCSVEGTPIVTGLVAEYAMNGSLADSAGSAHASPVGNPSFVPSPYGGDALLVTPGNFALVPSDVAFVPGSQSLTIGFHFNSTGGFIPVSQHIPLLTIQGGDFAEGITFLIGGSVGNDHVVGAFLDSGAVVRQSLNISQSSSLLGEWHHLALTLDRSAQSLGLFLDGVQMVQETLSLGSIDSTQDLLFGAYDYGNERNGLPRFLTGSSLLLDNLVIYDRALDSTELATLAGAGTSVPDGGNSAFLLVLAGISLFLGAKPSAAAV